MVKIRSNAIDMTGQKYYKLTGMYPVRHSKNGLIWRFKCDCGNEVEVLGVSVRRGNTKSCGCLLSQYELEISSLLRENNIEYQTQYGFDDLRFEHRLRFDFAILKKDQLLGLIEYNGRQHYEPVSKFGGEERLREYQLSDKMKEEYCIAHSIPLLSLNKDNYSKEVVLQWVAGLQ